MEMYSVGKPIHSYVKGNEIHEQGFNTHFFSMLVE